MQVILESSYCITFLELITTLPKRSQSIKINLFRSLVFDLSFNKIHLFLNSMNLETLSLSLPSIGVLALLFTWWKTQSINCTRRIGADDKNCSSIQEGAMAFLRAEYVS